MKVRTTRELAHAIKAARQHARLTQQALATVVGVQRLTIVRIERGDKLPSIDLLLRLVDALGADLSIEWGVTPDPAAKPLVSLDDIVGDPAP